jgi:hypothetical protein
VGACEEEGGPLGVVRGQVETAVCVSGGAEAAQRFFKANLQVRVCGCVGGYVGVGVGGWVGGCGCGCGWVGTWVGGCMHRRVGHARQCLCVRIMR